MRSCPAAAPTDLPAPDGLPQSRVAGDTAGQKGFTLIELSIVLIIIGLIVGGILVGQDLIRAAEIRATIAQVEKYNTAVNTFRGKYNAMPGDIAPAVATAFGLFGETTLAGTAGHGDGNGLIEGGSAAATVGLGETLTFWRHLSDANLVDGGFGASGNSLIVVATGAVTGTVVTIAQSLPPTKIAPIQSFVVYANSGLNFYQILPVATIPATGIYTYTGTGITPIQSFSIDSKLDDGSPFTGTVISRGIASVNAVASAAATTTANTCNVGTGTATTDTYNRNAASGGNDGSCSLRFRFN